VRGGSGADTPTVAEVSSSSRERIFAACAPGLEPVLARELSELGVPARPVPGGAEGEGPDAVARACLGSRVADAVRLRVWEGPARELAEARRRLRSRFAPRELLERRSGSRATISVDAGGEPVFKRGWRARVGAAPLRESLASGLLRQLGYDGSVAFLDPMCGSGTIAIEAALLASGRAPGLGRTYAFEAWSDREPGRTAALRTALTAAAREPAPPLQASDRNGGAVRLATRNAEAAGVSRFLRIERRDAIEVIPPSPPGVCLVNPPYGVRMNEEVEASWKALGRLLSRLEGWTVGVLAGSPAFEKLLPGSPVDALHVRNGGLRCVLLTYRP